MQEADNLYRVYQDAQKYISKIGAPQHHFRDGSVGKLCKLHLATEINHQANSGDTNYWKNSLFDWALSEIVQKHFNELAVEALAYMKQKADEALIAEKNELQERLSKIEELEKEIGE